MMHCAIYASGKIMYNQAEKQTPECLVSKQKMAIIRSFLHVNGVIILAIPG